MWILRSRTTANSIVSRHFNIQIRNEDDLEKIKVPVVTHDVAASEQQYEQLREIFAGTLDVKTRGANGFCFWFAPWDEMIRWWGVQELLIDLYDRPEFVHKAIDRLVNAYLSMLDQFEEQNLLRLNNTYYRIGSGGLGFTDELPRPGYDPDHVRARISGATVRLRSFPMFRPACTGSSRFSTRSAG